jgi:NitT/TauT family transport system permease protein
MNSRQDAVTKNTDSPPAADARREELPVQFGRRRWYRASRGLVTAGLVLSSLVIGIGLWQLIITVFNVPDYLVPAPVAVFKIYFNGQIDWAAQTLVTLEEGVIGFLIGVAVGFAIAVILSTSPLVNRIVMPYVVAFHVLPKVAIAPVIFIMLGFSDVSKILLVVILSFFPIVINVTTGLVNVDVNLVHLLRSLGVGPVTVFYKVRLPSSMPLFFDGLKIAVSGAMIGAIVAEFVSSNSGLGFVILNSQSTLDTSIAFAAIVILTVLGLLLYGAVILLGRLAMPWYRSN